MDALGRFVEDQQLRISDEGAGDGQLLLLAAAEQAALAAEQVLEHGEVFKDFAGHAARLRRISQHADLKVFQHGELRKNLAPLRHVAHARASPNVRRSARQVAAIKQHLPRTRPQEPHHALEQRGLAHAIAAHEANDPAGLDLQVHVTENERFTVSYLQSLYLQHQLACPVRDKPE